MTHSTDQSTATAQRRLLEAFAALNQTPGGIAGLLLGMPLAIQIAQDAELPAMVAVYEAFSDLAASIQSDLTMEETNV